jgi:VanZ family protein
LKAWAWRWAPAIAQMVAIFVASSIPDLRQLPGDVSDHTGHFIGYAILGGLMLHGSSAVGWRGASLKTGILALALTSGYGVTDEFHQRFVHGRTPAVDDWVADTAGAAAAIAIVVVVATILRGRNRTV